MHVQADEVEMGGALGALGRLGSGTGSPAEPELRILLAGLHLFEGVHLDARRHANHDRLG